MHVHISFKEALKAACLVGMPGPLWGRALPKNDGTATLVTEADITAFVTASETGAYLPMSLVIARPFIEHRMMSAVLSVAGTDTGATLFGPADMQISANTSVKTIEGHYTCHTRSVITKPQNVMVLRDIMCNGYVAGCNTTFFGKNKETGAYSVDDIRDQINARLTMAEGDDVDYPSMLAFPEKFDAATARDQVISISNRVLPWDTTNGDSRMQFPGGAEGWAQAGGKGLEGIHYGAPRCSERPLPAKPTSVFHPASAARAQARTCAPPQIRTSLRRRRSTTRSASSARTASTRSGARRTRSWFRGRATSAPTRFRAMPAGAAASRCRASRRATR